MAKGRPSSKLRLAARLHGARVRHMLLTSGPNRLSKGWLVRRHHDDPVALRELGITLLNWPAAFDGLRIAHVSDLHFGELMPRERALGIVEMIRRARPDMVCNTGDLVDLEIDGAQEVAEAIASIRASYGNYFVLGNHDELKCGETLKRLVRRAGTTVLDSEVCVVRRGDEELRVGGIGWARTPSHCRSRIDDARLHVTQVVAALDPEAAGQEASS